MIPAGVLVTIPCSEPPMLTVRVAVCAEANVAVTVVVAVNVTAHVPVPLHPPPLHPVNVDPVAGAAVSVTAAPLA